jgi:hypothetical protein
MDFGVHRNGAISLTILPNDLVLNKALHSVDPLKHVALLSANLFSFFAEAVLKFLVVIGV